jgi:two-component system, response regulator
MAIMTTIEDVEILLVEDNPNDVELTLRALQKHNLANKVFVVKDGAEALDFIFATGTFAHRKIENRPKVILLDLKLPKVDGIEVLRRTKGDERTRHTPIVMLTSSQEERDVLDTYDLGVNSYIVKPVDFSNFVRAVSELGFYWGVMNKIPY